MSSVVDNINNNDNVTKEGNVLTNDEYPRSNESGSTHSNSFKSNSGGISPTKKSVNICRKLTVVYVESYKRYNILNTHSGKVYTDTIIKNKKEEVKCKCILF